MQKQSRFKYTSVSLVFLTITVIHLSVSIFVSMLSEKFSISMALELIISELIILIPGAIWLLIENKPLADTLGFRRIKISTVLMTVLLAQLLSPLVTMVNLLSQLFEDNKALTLTQSLGDESSLIMVLLVGIYGPVCEELVFRGIISRRMMKYGSPIMAAFVSGLFFGLMHMNFNQFSYAIVLGIVFAIVNYATDSIWPSIIMHVVYNGKNAVLMVIMNALYSGMDIDLAEASETVRQGDTMLYMIGVYLILAVIFTLAAIPVFNFIAGNEGRPDAYTKLKVKPDTQEALAAGRSWYLNGFAIAAVAICVAVIFFMESILRLFGLG